MWLSLSGGVLCLLVMFIIDWATALLIFALFAIVFIYVHGRSGDVNWGSSIQAHHYRIALASLLSLTCTEEHVKNYRPQVLLLTGNPAARCALLDFGCAITKGDSLLIAAHIIPYPATEKTFRLVRRLNVQMTDWLRANKIKAFYLPFASTNLRAGAQNLFQTAGLGRLKPNIVLIGFKSDWNHYGIEGAMSIVDYVGIIRDAFENNCGVGILRNGTEGFDLSESLLELNISDITAFKNSTVEAPDLSVLSQTLPSLQSNTGFISSYSSGGMSFGDSFMSRASTIEEEFGDIETDYELEMAKTHTVYRQSTKFFSDRSIFSERHKSDDDNNSYSKLAKNAGVLPTEKQRKLAFQMNKFMSKVKNGRIDVWWLYDDGGLTLLIPHLLRLEKSYLEGAQLRVFTLSSSTTTEADEQRLAGLLIKFRIRFADVRIVSGAKDLPNESTMAEFKQLIQSMRTSYEGVIPGVISEHDLRKATRRTNRHLRTKEIIQKHSSAADLIIITMPIPRLEINSSLYMAWLDIMTRGLPPVLMIRGNQTSVLTFYS
ncbi:hypothetical protein AB6A40_008588 [Gnathostoma spinigerum]|uniref:SLC12A transporter C-terminal domain-containing protein n=1 Tax=Gnathostoma spinigerum TaxID=75299 RepID=A0ABD6EUL8_9BILA